MVRWCGDRTVKTSPCRGPKGSQRSRNAPPDTPEIALTTRATGSRRKATSSNPPKGSNGGGCARDAEDVALDRLLAAMEDLRDGNFRRRVTVGGDNEVTAKLAAAFNEIAERNQDLVGELMRVREAAGREGQFTERVRLDDMPGGWSIAGNLVNDTIDDLLQPTAELSRVLGAVADGDLSQRVSFHATRAPAGGELDSLSRTVNGLLDQLSMFASEVTRVATEIGIEGRLGGQAQVPGATGTWKDLTDSLNSMIANVTAQVRDVSQAAKAVARGDLSQKISVDVSGEVLELKFTFNTMVDQLSSFADEVTRVAREVGTDGRLGGQAQVPGVAGTWRDLTDSVNFMAENLTGQVRNIAQVATAVARGDLSQRIDVDARGEISALKNTINTMVDQLSSFADEVTRVAREVGSDGRLGGQAQVPGVAGTWRDLTDSVNFMAENLTGQVRNIAQVATAVARGDLSQKIDVDARGEISALKNTINTMVDQLSSFADEVTRVAREVGSDGRLGGQAQVPGVAGTWRDLTDSVNFMAENLTAQVRSIAQVTTAVARGDLSQKIDVDARGEISALKNTINTMVDQLSSFADEVTRVAREVGTDGRLGGQAQVPGVAGTWKDLTDNVNIMAENLTAQVRSIAQVTTAVARGDLSQKIDVDARGEISALKNTINTMVDQLSSFADEVTRVAREVGTDGRLGGQARVRGVAGTWKDLTDNVNIMAENLTAQVRSIATVATAVAGGDLSKKITVEAKGEVAALAETINGMVDTLRAFADEVTRVAREVGTEGTLGGQARVPNVAGTWKDLTDNTNFMANNLTSQVRNIAQVTTAVARGDLSKKIDVDARGEILELKNTINTMVDQLSAFASEVTRVAREVGTEGKLGGQAEVVGVSGTWQRLTESVNHLAGNLTSQVRAIAAVATAVTEGDLTRQITVDASGEVAELKGNINQMIANLRETTTSNLEQDWLKTNLARISGLMQGCHDLKALASLIMSELAPLVSAQYGSFYLATSDLDADVILERTAGYGSIPTDLVDAPPARFCLGESLVGQAAADKRTIVMAGASSYARISTGLGTVMPSNVILVPVLFEGQTLGVIELASVKDFTAVHRDLLEQLKETIGVNVNTIVANSRTEASLAQSQRLAQELQARSEQLQQQQEELQRSNIELAEKAALLASQNRDIEIKNIAIEQASQELEERARQLSLASTYKSEFLANMSHELRTPLNSVLILAKLLASDLHGNLTAQQIEFARTIYSAGTDLLQMIDDVLDLAKVEAGRMEMLVVPVTVEDLVGYVDSLYRPMAAEKGLDFSVTVSPMVPATLQTDRHRLQQILRNLLSNAVKFTHSGGVQLHIRLVGQSEVNSPSLQAAHSRVAFVVEDTGIGVAADKLALIFEAFQQADGTTSRKYGGTGLGLSISRELARLLGGELQVFSEAGRGSTFTLVLPMGEKIALTDQTSPGSQAMRGTPTSGAAIPATRPPGPAIPGGTKVPETRSSEPRKSDAESSRLEAAQKEAAQKEAAQKEAAAEKEATETAATASAATEMGTGEMGAADKENAEAAGGEPTSSGAQSPESWTPGAERQEEEPAGTPDGRMHDGTGHNGSGEYLSPSPSAHAAYAGNAPRPGSAEEARWRHFRTFEGEHILVVDDDPRYIYALATALEQHGLNPLCVENGVEAVRMLEQDTDVDLVLMDVMMPGLDGNATMTTIRKIPKYRELPILAVTAKAMKGDREQSLSAGATDYVTKPVDIDQLLHLIASYLPPGRVPQQNHPDRS
ncbi:HAMP domain-containing protein [Actinopolymorpha sp. NPDC004070]|uniref:HAMP domain-containing protein n=1 Tax=Actinopolymorpha sp. NPDC004070 TaxID=3154548 RepID=UPI0033BB9829